MRLPTGKVPIEVLQKIIFRHLGVKRKDVILGPAIGEDAAVVKVGKNLLMTSIDPITGALEKIGWLAVNVSANDIATRGVQPRWFTSCILLPKESTEKDVQRICNQIDEAARELGIAVVSGHSEVTPGLIHPVVIGCVMGIAEGGRYVTSSGAKPGNKLILTKGTGIEGTAILASDRRGVLSRKLGKDLVKRAEGFFGEISVVKDALIAFKTGGVTAMHDPTEGGVAGGLHELADAANIGFRIYEDRIRVSSETNEICKFFGIDPIQLISSGSLLIAVRSDKAITIMKKLEQNSIKASIIGDAVEPTAGRVIVSKTGKQKNLVRPVTDHLWVALAKSF